MGNRPCPCICIRGSSSDLDGCTSDIWTRSLENGPGNVWDTGCWTNVGTLRDRENGENVLIFPLCSLFSVTSDSRTSWWPAILTHVSCRYQLAVTQRKEEEPSSTSIYNLNDPWTPTVDFTDFINNETVSGQVSQQKAEGAWMSHFTRRPGSLKKRSFVISHFFVDQWAESLYTRLLQEACVSLAKPGIMILFLLPY